MQEPGRRAGRDFSPTGCNKFPVRYVYHDEVSMVLNVRPALALAFLALPLTAAPPDPAPLVPSHAQTGAPTGIGGPIGGGRYRDTFNGNVVRILQARCQTCHHDGDIAPFALVTYQDAFEHRFAIQYMTANRLMPPWHADSNCFEFKGNPSLSDEEMRALSTWVDVGAPE